MPVRRCATSALIVFLSAAAVVVAQVSMQPAPKPTVTAENEVWYQSGEPIAFGGNVYYPSGPVIHFLANEMIPRGMFDGVTIYARTTREPGSVIYVPLPGGLMRPYERRRTGEIAGTVGSTPPAFPVVLPSDQRARESGEYGQAPDSADRPVGTGSFVLGRSTERGPAVPAAVSSIGSVTAPGSMEPPTRSSFQTAQRPVGLNDIYVEFQDARWFAAGPAVEYSPDRFTRAVEYHGFPVFTRKDQPEVIYVQLVPGTPGLLTPYRKR